MTQDQIREIAWIAWKGAANAFRMYPDNKHTFTDYWDGAKNQFDQFKTPAPPPAGEKMREAVDWFMSTIPLDNGNTYLPGFNESLKALREVMSQPPGNDDVIKKAKVSLIWQMIEEWQDARSGEDIHAPLVSYNEIEADLYEWLEKIDPNPTPPNK